MIFQPLSFIYEGIYSARLLAYSSVFGVFFMPVKKKFRVSIFFIYTLLITFYASFSPFINFLNALGVTMKVLKPIHLAWYSILPATHFLVFSLCFEGSWTKKAFSYAFGVLAECAFFGWFYLFYDLGVFELRVHTPVAVIVEILLSTVVIAGIYFALKYYTRKHPLRESFHLGDFLISFAIVVGITFLRLQLQGVYELVRGSDKGWVISFTLGFIPIIFLAVIFSFNSLEDKKQESAMLNQVLTEQARSYKNSIENVEVINRKCHDLRKQIRALEFVSEEERSSSLKNIVRSVNMYDNSVQTDNPALNALLNEKGLTCMSKGIRFSKMIDADALKTIDVVDLYVLLGNMLDNAIEACDRVEEKEKKIISLKIDQNIGFIFLRMENYCQEVLRLKDGLPVTSKQDKNYHGFGVKSIRHIAEKYGGKMTICVDDDLFTILVAIPQK